jgi:hypothetical protein
MRLRVNGEDTKARPILIAAHCLAQSFRDAKESIAHNGLPSDHREDPPTSYYVTFHFRVQTALERNQVWHIHLTSHEDCKSASIFQRYWTAPGSSMPILVLGFYVSWTVHACLRSLTL